VAEDQVGKLGYGSDANEQIGDRAEEIVPAVEWLEQRHCSITFPRKGFALVTARKSLAERPLVAGCRGKACASIRRTRYRDKTNFFEAPTDFLAIGVET
jgi:hypothetical protein